MIQYIKKYLRDETKYHIKLIRLDPTITTYMDIVSIVDEFRDKDYEVHGVFIDYLSQISTEGCVKTGPSGVEYKDLFKRMRTEMSKRKILLVTPHQISTEAKRLIKNGIPDIEFVKQLPGKGYYAHSGQLDQEIDLEIFLHKAYRNRKPVLTIQRGKHRIPTNIEDEDKFMMLQFPKGGAPIPEDSEDHQACIKDDLENDEFGW